MTIGEYPPNKPWFSLIRGWHYSDPFRSEVPAMNGTESSAAMAAPSTAFDRLRAAGA